MAYSDFTLPRVIEELEIHLIEDRNLFHSIAPLPPSDFLTLYFSRGSAFSLLSESARRERIIAPILDDVFLTDPRCFTIFSNENFDVDKQRSLNGSADYLICQSDNTYTVVAPVIAMVESKRNDVADGLGQCIAELYAAALFNQKRKQPQNLLYGIVSNGRDWLFGEYDVPTHTFTYNPNPFSWQNLPAIIGILTAMRNRYSMES